MLTAFATDFAAARCGFQTATILAGGSIRSFALGDMQGPNGELLATDLAWFGDSAPRAALIVTSATHGVEGYAGSALQVRIAQALKGARRATDIGVVLIHAINPYGFAHTRRVNEHNVDLNRNFVDFAQLPSCGAEYRHLHRWLVPCHWRGPDRLRADAQLDEVIEKRGNRFFQQAVCEGQYEFADGLFFGGRAPTWSNCIWRMVLSELPASVLCIGHLDIHTGLGPYGYGEILFTLPNDPSTLGLAQAWYGDLGLQVHGATSSAATGVFGTMNHAVWELALCRRVCSVSVEFGTVEFGRMLNALRADNWLHAHGQIDSKAGALIKRELRDCFYPVDAQWQAGVLDRGMQVFERTHRELEHYLRQP